MISCFHVKVRVEKSVARSHCQVQREALPHHQQLSAAAAQAGDGPFQAQKLAIFITHRNHHNGGLPWYHMIHAAKLGTPLRIADS